MCRTQPLLYGSPIPLLHHSFYRKLDAASVLSAYSAVQERVRLALKEQKYGPSELFVFAKEVCCSVFLKQCQIHGTIRPRVWRTVVRTGDARTNCWRRNTIDTGQSKISSNAPHVEVHLSPTDRDRSTPYQPSTLLQTLECPCALCRVSCVLVFFRLLTGCGSGKRCASFSLSRQVCGETD